MSVNEDLIQANSDSFWEVDCYKRTSKRHEDGYKLANDLMQFIQERAAIEKEYAKALQAHTTKWNGMIEKGPEYGTMEAGWKSVLAEADSVAELHIRIKDRLLQDVQNQIKQWRNENYHKPMVGPSKESKELEDSFRKAQKPWAKRLAKVLKCKKDYHTACKLEKTATHQENNARGDSGISPDQLKKLQDKVEKCKKDVEVTRDKYEAALNDINGYNAKYMEDMTEIFNKSQEFEEKRLKFFKEMLFGIQKSINLSETDEYAQIYQQLWSTVNMCDHQKDLRWWSQNHGVDMAMNWPSLEEYSPELHSIGSKKKAVQVSGGDGITLTSISKSDHRAPSPVVQQRPASQTYDNYSMTNTTNNQQTSNPESNGAPPNQQNPFGEDDWDSYEQTQIDDSKGVPVRALYDYLGQEDDELSFKAGDIFMKLLDADEQGWCTGKNDVKVGLYPNNYVEPVE